MRICTKLFGCAAVAALFITTASSVEAVMLGADRIRVTQNLATDFHIAEIEAFDTDSGMNVASQANGGVASASSIDFGTIAGDANDGNTNGSFGAGSVWHAARGNAQGEFVEVNLNPGGNALTNVTIWNRTDCCQTRENNFKLQIWDADNNELFNQDIITNGGPNGGSFFFQDITVNIVTGDPTPEPAAGLMFATGVLGMGFLRRRHRRRT